MAVEEDESQPTEQRIKRQVGRSIANWVAVLISVALLAAWVSAGFYSLRPGEAAVILFLGGYDRTELDEGLRWHLPPPLVYDTKVNVSEQRREVFGPQIGRPEDAEREEATNENVIQTADNNVVNLGFVVQYDVEDPFSYLYGIAKPTETLRDAAMSAVRGVVGRKSVEAVLETERTQIQEEARTTLQASLDRYFAARGLSPAFRIGSIDLQDVQPPEPVQAAFNDVNAAGQDQERSIAQATGDAREILERSVAQATELMNEAAAYKDSRILEARGEAARFLALVTEYQRAPEVTARRLYLETMEVIMPGVEKVIVDPTAVDVLPFLGLGSSPAPVIAGGGGAKP